jgi:flagellum-specific ATP synthase
MEDIHIGQTALFIEEPIFKPSENWIGNILNHEAQRIDGRLLKPGLRAINLKGAPPPAVLRKGLGPRLSTGVLAVDTFLPLCLGQRVGLFAGSGVGKSTLLGTLAKKSHADINIIALIGERGREVRHFVDNILGPEGMAKSIIFAATSDESSAIKLRTAQLAMATAEYFRDTGAQVLYLFDSLTRYAEAHRDLAISAGEIPALRGYPPSTFRALASLCERAGPGLEDKGDITAIFSVLVAGSDMEEPVADMVRGILDGHMILEREIAERGRYPAIDIRKSVSRSLPDAATDAENKILQKARELIMTYETSRGIIQAGLYVAGSDVKLDEAIECYPRIEALISNLNIETIEAGFTALSDAIARREEQISDTGGTEAG